MLQWESLLERNWVYYGSSNWCKLALKTIVEQTILYYYQYVMKMKPIRTTHCSKLCGGLQFGRCKG